MTAKLRYSDGKVIVKTFKDIKELEWFVHNEGDHLLEVTLVDDSLRNS